MITKPQILENLKVKLGATQKITDRTIEESIEPFMAGITEETTLGSIVDVLLPILTSVNGNFIKDTTDFVKSYKPTAEPPQPLLKADPAPTAEPPQPKAPDVAQMTPEMIQAMIKEAMAPNIDALRVMQNEKQKNQVFADARNLPNARIVDEPYKTQSDFAWELTEASYAANPTMSAEEVGADWRNKYGRIIGAEVEATFIPLTGGTSPSDTPKDWTDVENYIEGNERLKSILNIKP